MVCDINIKALIYYEQLLLRLLGALLLFFSNNIIAKNLYVDRIGLKEGLSQNSVTAITQDKRGFMWIATQDGLMRYDGYTFINHLPDNNNLHSISNKTVWSLLVDKEGIIWAGTYGGLNRYDPMTERFTSYQHNPEDLHGISNNMAMALLEDSKGNFWIATDFGLNLFDRNSEVFTHFIHDAADEFSISNNFVNAVFEDRNGALWVGTDQGVNEYNYETQTFEHVYFANTILKSALIQAIGEDGYGRLWVGTGNDGVFVINTEQKNILHFKHNPRDPRSLSSNNITVIYKDKHQQMWVGTDDAGLNTYNDKLKQFVRYRHNPNDDHSLSGDNIYSLYEDQSGVFWIGTYTFGISKFNPYSFSLSLVSDKPTASDPNPSTDVRPFLVDQNKSLWVGSSYNGVKVTDANGTIRNYLHDPNDDSSLSSNRVYGLYEDKAGVVWVGTLGGWLNEYDSVSNSFNRYSMQSETENGIYHEKVKVMWEDKEGVFWVAMDGGGLHTFNRETKEIKHFHHDPKDPTSISSNRIFVIHEDRKDQLWFASYGGGLNKYDRNTKTFSAFKHNDDVNSLSNDFLMAVCEDNKKNILWLGSDGGGIDRFDMDNESFVSYNTKDGLPNSALYGILQDDKGQLWVSHNKGLSRFNPEKNIFYNYDEQEGLQSNEFNGGSYYKAPDGKFYFGGIHGFNAFYPEQIIDNPHAPPVYITNFQLFNNSVGVNERFDNRIILTKPVTDIANLTLSYKDTVFSFEFAALDFALSQKNQYAYRMQGLEENWNYVDSRRRFTTYTTLPPGDYIFQVKASNNHGVWNQDGVSLPITILPPFWSTWWFRLVIGVAIIILLFTAYTLRVRAVHARNKILEEQVKARTEDLENTLYELSDTKDALIESAHKAGMADTASGVLHNVGNLLNSVNTSAGIIRETLDNSVMNKMHKANQLLIDNQDKLSYFITQDPKGKKLLNYYINLDQPLVSEQAILKENILRLKDKITAINETVSAQQRYAHGGGFFEYLTLETLIEDSILLQSASIDRHEIKIERKYDVDVPQVKVQKAKLIQILINLYKNAKESMDACSINHNKLIIEISQDHKFVYISYTDTGVGIAPDKLETIFAHGFTTKAGGHGFGLHSCANYMTEMGGEMWAESDGSNQGAKFILKFSKSDIKQLADNEAAHGHPVIKKTA